ncbi:hypothetical protein E6O75_ATG11508 [Venturia nashicola]|uniref:FR47-like domain-containing protein n=1 Tax=Venturia nashicola TaxID=86259 RepID=A0A4Z1NL46_9PEZI|nr:hypothetical protein E6O75_ATG11508 [Venturia nashicola]
MSTTFIHPVSGESLLPILRRNLPHSLPLYRRLQFEHRSSSSHVLATFPPSNDNHAGTNTNPPTDSTCFATAFVDRSRRPETECWIFLSSEVPGTCPNTEPQTTSPKNPPSNPCPTCRTALLSILAHISTLRPPPTTDESLKQEENPLLSHLTNPRVMLIGALNTITATMLKDAIPPEWLEYMNILYLKFLFKTSQLPANVDAPTGFRWGKVRHRDFALVRSRTSIPRQDRTLALLPSLALFPVIEDAQKGEDVSPIAWSFLGPDASLSSLHCEPAYRGKGFAKVLARKLFREGGYGDEVKHTDEEIDGGRWAHADVALDNISSQGVCKSLGGEAAWNVVWIRVDLDRIADMVLRDA